MNAYTPPIIFAVVGLLMACAVDIEVPEPAIETDDAALTLRSTREPGPTRGNECTTVTSVFDVDVPSVEIDGTFTVNGAQPLNDPDQTGRIELRNDTLGVIDLGAIYGGDYSRSIIPGVYDVVYRHTAGDIPPANAETIVLDDADLSAGGTFDIDIPSVLVMGDITLNGGPTPGGSYQNGEIQLRDTTTGATFGVGYSNDGNYFAMVIPGEYDVLFRHMIGDQVPANTASVLVEGVTVAGLTELDIDIPAVERTGDFLINGVPAPVGVYEQGQIALRDTVTGDVFDVARTREQSYSLVVVPGTYDVIYSRLLGDSQVPANAFAVVAEDVDLTTDGALDIDIPMVTISGSFSLDGVHFPGGSYNRARFWLQGEEEGDVFPIGTTDDSTYEQLIIPGTYDLVYEAMISTGMVPENPWSVVSTGHILSPFLRSGSVTFDVAVESGWLAVDVTVWGEEPLHGVYENGDIFGDDGTGEPVLIGQTRDGGGSVRALAAPYGIHYSHLIGDSVPFNNDALVGEGQASPFVLPAAVDLQPGQLAGDFTQDGLAFTVNPLHHGVISLRDRETGDLVELNATVYGNYDRSLLGGTYDVIYTHVSGVWVVGNRDAELGCIEFVPEPPPAEPIDDVTW